MFDIITFGSATKDIIIQTKKLTYLKYQKSSHEGKEICFPLGSKIDIEKINFAMGGGGFNSAATFALQGFKTAFCGMVGNDLTGKEILFELKKLKISTKFIKKTNKLPTNYSIVIAGDGIDRTILTFRGAAQLFSAELIPWKKLKARWFYIAPLTGLLCDAFERLVSFAFDKGIKVAVNPSIAQLSLANSIIKHIFSKTDILILNEEEASFLTKIPLEKEEEIFKIVDNMYPGIFVMTKGARGVTVSDGKYIYSASPPLNRKVVDATGAGDSFASGFVSEFIKKRGNIEKAIQLGMANAMANLKEVGAISGLLKKNEKFEAVFVSKKPIFS